MFELCSSYFFIKLNMSSSNWKVVIPGVCKRLDTGFQTVPDTGCRGAKKQLCKDSQTVPGLQKKEAPEHIKNGSGTHKKAAPDCAGRGSGTHKKAAPNCAGKGSGTHKKAANCQKENGQEKPSFRLFLPACISVLMLFLFYTGRSGFNPLIQIPSSPFLSARLRSVLSFSLPGAFR